MLSQRTSDNKCNNIFNFMKLNAIASIYVLRNNVSKLVTIKLKMSYEKSQGIN